MLISGKVLNGADVSNPDTMVVTIREVSGSSFFFMTMCRSAAWACVGAAAGVGMNLVRATRPQLRNSAIGGALGGAIGGMFFDPIDRFAVSSLFAGSESSRLVGLLAVGLSIGIFVALVERLARDAWLRVRTGPLAGKSFILFKTPTVVGNAPGIGRLPLQGRRDRSGSRVDPPGRHDLRDRGHGQPHGHHGRRHQGAAAAPGVGRSDHDRQHDPRLRRTPEAHAPGLSDEHAQERTRHGRRTEPEGQPQARRADLPGVQDRARARHRRIGVHRVRGPAPRALLEQLRRLRQARLRQRAAQAPGPAGVRRTDGPPPLPAGMMPCPACRHPIMMGDPLCPYCRAITSPDGIYHGPKTNAPGAVASLVFGIIGLLFCGVIFGPLAIARSSSAKREIAMNPTYGGGGMATAGMVLGILDLVAWGILLLMRLGSQ
jgi:hypothetical protein